MPELTPALIAVCLGENVTRVSFIASPSPLPLISIFRPLVQQTLVLDTFVK